MEETGPRPGHRDGVRQPDRHPRYPKRQPLCGGAAHALGAGAGGGALPQHRQHPAPLLPGLLPLGGRGVRGGRGAPRGTHGTLEWLPGKEIGLSSGCFGDICIGGMPHLYIYNISILGEGMQAKRRSYACILDHLIPSMDDADTYAASPIWTRPSTATITPARPGLPRCPHCWSGSSPWRRSWR